MREINYFCTFFNWVTFINNDLNIYYVIGPGDMEMGYLGYHGKLWSHDKIKGIIVHCTRNNVLFTNEIVC